MVELAEETAPSVITNAASVINNTAATLKGNVMSHGSSALTERGFYWSTTNGFANGTGTKVTVSNTTINGVYSSPFTGTAGTTYYYKAFATNSAGTTFGAQQSFTLTVPDNGTHRLTGSISPSGIHPRQRDTPWRRNAHCHRNAPH